MGQVGDTVGEPAQPAFGGRRRWLDPPRVGPDPVEHLAAQVQRLEELDGPHAVLRVEPLASDERGERLLPGVTEWRVADVVGRDRSPR